MKMNTSLTTKQIEEKTQQFINLYKQGVEAWTQAGKIIVEVLDDYPHAADEITKQCPQLTPSIIGIFERIGRGQLLPSLAVDSSPGIARLRELPMSSQKRYEIEPVPLVVETASGTDILLVDVKNLTKLQARQVFANGRMRSEGEQKAFLIEQTSKERRATKTTEIPAWRVRNGRVIFEKGATLTAGELATIITQIAK